MAPRSLFGRTALVIALVSFAFQVFTLAVITYFALIPLGRDATDDVAALMLGTAQAWHSASPAERPQLQERIGRLHRLSAGRPNTRARRSRRGWQAAQRTGRCACSRRTQASGNREAGC